MSTDKTTTEESKEPQAPGQDFESLADQQSAGLFAEFVAFLSYNKKWWLTPILLVLLLVGALLVFGGGIAAPFIYPLF